VTFVMWCSIRIAGLYPSVGAVRSSSTSRIMGA